MLKRGDRKSKRNKLVEIYVMRNISRTFMSDFHYKDNELLIKMWQTSRNSRSTDDKSRGR